MAHPLFVRVTGAVPLRRRDALGSDRWFDGHQPDDDRSDREDSMLWTIAMVLVLLWLLGLVTSYTMGGFVHLLLVLAVIAVLFRVISGRRQI